MIDTLKNRGEQITAPASDPQRAVRFRVRRLFMGSYVPILLALVVVMIIGSFASPYFLTARNLQNIILTGAIVSILAIGQFMVIVTAGIDLSVGAVLAVSLMVNAWLFRDFGLPFAVTALAGLGVGAFVGLEHDMDGLLPFLPDDTIEPDWDTPVPEFLAHKITANVRELEGGLNRVVAHAQLVGREIGTKELIIGLALDPQALLGAPLKIGTTVVISFLFLGQVLNLSGGSKFFTDLATSAMGQYRGGSAKIAVIASSLFGSISGSAVSNVASTGVVTIPLMRESGYTKETAGAIEDIGKAVAIHLDRQGLAFAGRYVDIEISRICGDAVDGASLAPEVPADDAHGGAIVIGDLGDVCTGHILVAGIRHLLGGGQIGPQLKAVHASGVITLGHLLVQDPRPGGHPLDVAGAEGALIPQAVAMVDGACEHIGNGLDAAVRMPWEAGHIVGGLIATKVIEEQKRIGLFRVAETEGATQADTGTFDVGLGFDDAFDGTDGHDGPRSARVGVNR